MKLTEKLIEQKSELASKIIKKFKDEIFSDIALVYNFETNRFNPIVFYNGYDYDENYDYIRLDDMSSSYNFIVFDVFSKKEYYDLGSYEHQEFYEKAIENCAKTLEELL